MIGLFFIANVRKELPLVIYIFLLLFAPPFFKDVNFLLILAVFSIIMLIFKYSDKIRLITKNKYLKKAIFLIGIYYLWQIVSIIINALSGEIHLYNYAINFYSMLLVFPVAFICCLHVIFYCQDKKINFDGLIKIIIYAGLIQSVIAILAFLFPSVKEFLLNVMYENTGEKLYLNTYHTTRRFFGFANNLLDSFGFGTGILAVLSLFYSVKNGKKWLLSVPFLLLVPLLNSRTGLLLFGIGFIVWIIYLLKNKLFNKYLKIFFCLIVAVLVIISLTYVFYPDTINWIIDDFLSFFGNKHGTADVLFSARFWTLPNLFNIFFGSGIMVAAFGGLGDYLGFTSDVGYIVEIWKTGIVGLVLMLALLFYVVKVMLKNINKDYKYLVIFLCISVLVTNIKFYVYGYNPGIIVIMLFFLFLILEKIKHNEKVQSQELISVIIPVYNVEKYLARCLNSIVKQTYKNLEIILVNDGSTDNSEDIIKKYEKKDNRIKYIKQKNSGLSSARNTGIKNSYGNYLSFIDGDDYVNVHFIEDLYSALVNSGADIAICDYKKVYEKNCDIYSKNVSLIETVYDNKFDNLYNDRATVTTVAWNKLYKREMFNKIKYPNGRVHEDEYVIPYLLDKANKITYTSCKYYYYYQRSDSITGSYNVKRLDILKALKERIKFFQNKKMKKLQARALYNYYYQLCYQKMMMCRFYKDDKKNIKKIDKEIKNNKYNFFTNIYINPLRKLKILIKFYVK